MGCPSENRKKKAKSDTIMSYIQLFWEMDNCHICIDHE